MKALLAVGLWFAAQSAGIAAPGASASGERPQIEYRLSGAKILYPSKIRDDGSYTYLAWPIDAELPAVFSRGADGREVVAEGVMMGDEYVLDRIHTTLVFRIDRQVAIASRRVKRRE